MRRGRRGPGCCFRFSHGGRASQGPTATAAQTPGVSPIYGNLLVTVNSGLLGEPSSQVGPIGVVGPTVPYGSTATTDRSASFSTMLAGHWYGRLENTDGADAGASRDAHGDGVRIAAVDLETAAGDVTPESADALAISRSDRIVELGLLLGRWLSPAVITGARDSQRRPERLARDARRDRSRTSPGAGSAATGPLGPDRSGGPGNPDRTHRRLGGCLPLASVRGAIVAAIPQWAVESSDSPEPPVRNWKWNGPWTPVVPPKRCRTLRARPIAKRSATERRSGQPSRDVRPPTGDNGLAKGGMQVSRTITPLPRSLSEYSPSFDVSPC